MHHRLSSPHYLSIPILLFLYTLITISIPSPHPISLSLLSPAPSSSFASASFSPPPPGLIWAQLIHRHGDRTPIHPFPNNSVWNDYRLPPGSLTSIGWAQHAAVGRWVRERYAVNTSSSFLSEWQYEPRSLQVRSTQVERCMQSITALLTGLYPPRLNHSAVDAAQASRKTTLTPYPPVDVMPIPLDALLQATDKCPSYALTYPDTQRASSERIDVLYPDLHAQLLALTNMSTFSVASSVAMLVSWAADNLLCEEAHGLSSSAELTALYEVLTALSRYVSYERFVGDPRDARGSIGDLLLRDVARSVLNKVRVSERPEEVGGDGDDWYDMYADEKLRIYSAHDTTVVSLLASFHLLDNASFWLLPPYATVVSMDMRRTGDVPARYTMQWRIGYPKLTSDEEGQDAWYMQDGPLAIPCPADDELDRGSTIPLAYVCDVASFLRYVLIMTDPLYDSADAAHTSRLPSSTSDVDALLALLPLFPGPSPLYTYPADDGCCVPPADLAKRCPTSHTYEQSSMGCQLMRRLCPEQACGEGMTVAVGSFACVGQSTDREAVKDGVIVGASLAIALLLGVIGLQWRRSVAPGYEEINEKGVRVNGIPPSQPPEPVGEGSTVFRGAGQKARAKVSRGGERVRAMVEQAHAGLKDGGGRKRREKGDEEENEKLELTDAPVDDDSEDVAVMS